MNKKEKFLISIVGPTAIGKTSFSILLAQHLKTEIISCDSRQFFREMKIGTACPTQEELASVPHHFIGHLSIEENYSVGDFEKDAINKITELFEKYDYLIMVGGSGLYEKAVNEGLDEFPEIHPEIKRKLIKDYQKNGIRYLQEQLKKSDFEYYSRVDRNNPVRMIRALEIFQGTGIPYSFFRNRLNKERNFTTIKIGLMAPKEIIYKRINQRVDLMIENGLLKEVRALVPYRHKNALQTVGYKELFNYLDDTITLDFAIEEIKKNTRRYAKRQLTWYRKDKNVHWFDYQDTKGILDLVSTKISS